MIKKIRTLPLYKTTPVIMITGSEELENLQTNDRFFKCIQKVQYIVILLKDFFLFRTYFSHMRGNPVQSFKFSQVDFHYLTEAMRKYCMPESIPRTAYVYPGK